MKTFVPEIIFYTIGNFVQLKAVILCILCLNIEVFNLSNSGYGASAEPTSQQEQELLLLDALGKRQASQSSLNYGSSNSLMDMLGRSM